MTVISELVNLMPSGVIFGFGLTSVSCLIGLAAKKIFYMVANMSGY